MQMQAQLKQQAQALARAQASSTSPSPHLQVRPQPMARPHDAATTQGQADHHTQQPSASAASAALDDQPSHIENARENEALPVAKDTDQDRPIPGNASGGSVKDPLMGFREDDRATATRQEQSHARRHADGINSIASAIADAWTFALPQVISAPWTLLLTYASGKLFHWASPS